MSKRILRTKTAKSKPVKPEKPHKDYPLTPHNRGQWCKKVRGKVYYFGEWSDPDGALNRWLEVKDHLLAGRDPKERAGAWDVERLAFTFLDSKQQQVDQGDLAPRTLAGYKASCERFTNYFGRQRLIDTIDAPDFARYRSSFPTTWGPVRVNSEIRDVSIMLNFAYEIGAVDKPFRTGPNFKRVSAKKLRFNRASKPKKEFSASEIHKLIDIADVQLKAMILLAINCGFGNADCARLTEDAIDLKGKWYEQLRHKTGVPRAAWLWPETVKAITNAIDARFEGADEDLDGYVFITKYRQLWYREKAGTDAVSPAFGKLTKAVKCNRDGVGFYALRHTFETVAGNTKDQVAVNYVMGHCDQSMSAVYREGIDPKRIEAVCKHVRKWFLAGKTKPKRTAKKGGAK